MGEEKFKFIDESHDRKYFTILPNFIVNHSTFEEQGFYGFLKRTAGEHGLIYYSPREMARKGGIGKSRVYQLLTSLLKRGWIKEAGVIPAKTKPRMTYAIVDLWDKNNRFYQSQKEKEIVHHTDNLNKISNREKRLSTTRTKIVHHTDTKEEQGKEDIYNISKADVDKNTNPRSKPHGFAPIQDILKKGDPAKYAGRARVGGVIYQWQDHAVRIAKKLGIKPTPSWFKFFRNGRPTLLEITFQAIVDANCKDPEKYFYKVYRSKDNPKIAT